MAITLGRTVILVNDYDEALQFYQQNFGCNVLHDKETETNNRYLHIAFDNTDTGIWFIKADSAEQQQLIGKQTFGQPVIVLYTDELHELYQRLVDNKVTIRVEPIYNTGYQFFHCCDLYGNEIVVVQLSKEEEDV